MTREEFLQYVRETYGREPDFPFEDLHETAVFRHPENRKWFALVMTVGYNRLGLSHEGTVDIVNLKTAPELLHDMWQQEGVHPAYHMNRSHWISIRLDNTASDDIIRFALDVSYDLTKSKIRKKSKNSSETP